MFSEIVMMMLVGRTLTQSSALWMSILLVPSSLLIMMGWGNFNDFSALMVMLVVLVFIGGLLVLLVGTASTVSQEQSTASMMGMLTMMGVIIMLVLLEVKLPSSSYQLFILSWTTWGLMGMGFLMGVLLIALSLMTWLSTAFKGALRGM